MNNRLCILGMLLIGFSGIPVAAREAGPEFNFYHGTFKSPYSFFIPTVASWLSMNGFMAFYNQRIPKREPAFVGFLFGLFFSASSLVAAEYGSSYEYLGRWTTLALCAVVTSIVLACGNKAEEDAKVQMGIAYTSGLIGIGASYLLFTYG